MKAYQRPEIVPCGFAQQVIQANSKETLADDAQAPHDIPATTTAYEADE
jgi:hypothetical protein